MKTLEKFTYNREYKTLKKKEQKYLKKQSMSSDHFINRKLKGKVEPKLEQTLNSTFQKAFTLVFDKGVGIIQKTYNADKIKKNMILLILESLVKIFVNKKTYQNHPI